MNVTVTWKTGFVQKYFFDYATQRRVDSLRKHYESLSWVDTVTFEKV